MTGKEKERGTDGYFTNMEIKLNYMIISLPDRLSDRYFTQGSHSGKSEGRLRGRKEQLEYCTE